MKKLLYKYKFLFGIYSLFFIFVMIIGIYKTNYSVTTTGSITNTSSFISIDDTHSPSGSLNSVFVYSNDHSTIFQNWCAKLDKNASLDKLGTNYSKFSSADLYKMGVIQKNQSLECAAITAYNAAHSINSDITIDYTYKGLIVNYLIISSDNQFKIGDIITKINGVDTSNYNDFKSAYLEMYVGSNVEILRDGISLSFTLNEASSNYVKNDSLYSHISVYDKFIINDTKPLLSYHSVNSLGPSAGLITTLAIYNLLIEDDITHGKKIVGTGTIETNSNVGAIGGIEQKVIAAFKNKANVFLCPSTNYEDALAQYQKLGSRKSRMKLISVSNFNEALEVLNGLS